MTPSRQLKPAIEDQCVVDGCTREARATVDLCHTHYMRKRRNGSVDLGVIPSVNLASMAPIGRNIVALRLRAAMSAAKLARLCALSDHTIWHIGRGGSCNLDTLRTIASVFNVEVWELLKPDHFPLTEDVQR